ncbi:MAG: pyruvate formate lyase family protein [Armatimonadota bacterium]
MTLAAKEIAADTEFLAEINEWGIKGFYEGLDLPWPRAYGLALRRLFEHIDIDLPEDRYLLPHQPYPNAWTRETHGCWTAVGYILDYNHHSGIRITPEIAAEKKTRFPQFADRIDALVADLLPRMLHFGGYTHSNPDIRRVVDEGFLAMENELDVQLAMVQAEDEQADGETLSLLLALKDFSIGARTFHQRTAERLLLAADEASGERKRKLTLIAESFAAGFLVPSNTFLSGLLAVNFTWMLDGCDSIGRFDQALGALYEQDLANGTLDVEFARQLLDELFLSFEQLNGWNLQIGGRTPEGRDGTNALTLECIDACARNKFRRPNVAFRVTADTPDTALIRALQALGAGSGRPALYNDDLYIKTLYEMDLGLTLEDAREIGFGGCTETMIAGLSNVGSLEGEINLAKALELALHDGFDPVRKFQVGPHTGRFADCTDFPAFLDAVKRQIQYLTDAFIAWDHEQLRKRFHQGDPKLARTMFTGDCVKKRKSFEAGGARYNWAVVSYQGAANLIDSLVAVRECVFTRNAIGKEALIAALGADYEGNEPIRQQLMAAPKFGNDDPSVDALGREIIDYAWAQLYAHETPRGGRYLPSCILFTTYLGAGQQVGATPDGRTSRTALTDSIGAVAGRDTHGPTALLNSVAHLPLNRAVGTPVLNLRFQQRVMASEEGVHGVAALVRTFFAKGGMQAQITVISKEDMLAAQEHPEDYRDLIVRIGGYSEYFTALPRELQETVIARTEYTV